jgi:hypothetical protein
MEELMLIENPYYYRKSKSRKGGKMKNPVKGVTKEWFQGVNLMEAGAALGGLAAATMIPGLVVKDATTTTNKLLKLGTSALATVAAGFIARNVSPNAGKMAIAGGLAGTLSQALGMFTNVQIGQRQLAAPARRSISRLGQTVVPEFEGVKIS